MLSLSGFRTSGNSAQVPLATLAKVEIYKHGKELSLTLRPEVSADKLRLIFATAAEGKRCFETLEKLRQQLSPNALPELRAIPEGVSLVCQAPKVAHVIVGRIEFADRTAEKADAGLQLRAGMLGADAVIEVEREKCPELGFGARQVSGVAVRVEDPIGRQRLRWRWFGENVAGLVKHMFLLLVAQAALLFLAKAFGPRAPILYPETVETYSEELVALGKGFGMLYVWPLVVLLLLRVLRRPELLRVAALTILAATTGRGLFLLIFNGLLIHATGTSWTGKNLWILLDPFDWAIIIIGARLGLRAWRLANKARDVLPPESQEATPASLVWSRGLLAATSPFTPLPS